MPSAAETTIRSHGWRGGARTALAALACITLAGCGGGPGGGQPDLVVKSPGVSNASPAAGASLMFRATVRNAGDRSAAATTLRVFRSDDATVTTSDEQVGASAIAALAAAASRVASVELTASSSPGTYYYGACVDAVAGESDTANGCSAAVEVTVPAAQDETPPAPVPDLVVESPAVSAATPVAGEIFTFRAMVRNAGYGDAAATMLSVSRSDDATITPADEQVGADTVPELAASATSGASVELTAPSSSGTYYYGACVQAVAEESDTANNCSAPVQVAVQAPKVGPPHVGAPSSAAPDLEIAAWAEPSDPAIGGTFRLHMTLRNAGVGGGEYWVPGQVYRSEDATFTESDPRVPGGGFSRPVPTSPPTEEFSIFLDSPSTKGEHYYRVCVEPVPRESDTTNNCSAVVKIEVSDDKPDLYIYGTTVGGWDGSSFKLGASVRNLGGPSAATTLRFYQSPDDVITPSDVEVGATLVPELIKEQPNTPPAFTGSLVSVPAPATSGTHHYGACVDTVTGESDTTNNCSRAFHKIRT